MKSETFAEILKEKIEKTKTKEAKLHFHSQFQEKSASAWSTTQIVDLSIFQTRRELFNGKVNQTPYNQFKSTAKSPENRPSSRFHDQPSTSLTRPLSHKGASKVEPIQRPRMAAHKLNELQAHSMSYFITEKMFLLDDFTRDELKKAYKHLALKKHPDRQNGSSEFFMELKKHYEILSTVPKK